MLLVSNAKSILNGLEYSGNFSTGAEANSNFMVSKACYYFDIHLNSLWLDSRLLIGAATLAKTKDKPVVIIGETQELLDSLDICGCFPISNCSNLILGHM